MHSKEIVSTIQVLHLVEGKDVSPMFYVDLVITVRGKKYNDTFNSETKCERVAVQLIDCCTLECVIVVHHIFTDDKNIALCDGSTDQVCPPIEWRRVAFC